MPLILEHLAKLQRRISHKQPVNQRPPLHDGLLVKESVAEDVEQVMEECAAKTVGVELPVSIKRYTE